MTAPADWLDYLRVPLALLFVAGLIFFTGFLAKRSGLDKRLTGNKAAARLSIVETLYLDPRRRVVIVRDGDREHVLLLSAGGDALIESRGKEGADGE